MDCYSQAPLNRQRTSLSVMLVALRSARFKRKSYYVRLLFQMNVLRGGDFFFAMIQLLQVKKKFKKWLF